jgi:hypothetical protein
MAAINVLPADFLAIGLEWAGFDASRQNGRHETNVRRFVAFYGAYPETCSAIFTDFQTTQIFAARIPKPSVLNFLMTLFFLKRYNTEDVIAGTFKVDEKTARKWVWKYIRAMQALKAEKVRVFVGLNVM